MEAISILLIVVVLPLTDQFHDPALCFLIYAFTSKNLLPNKKRIFANNTRSLKVDHR